MLHQTSGKAARVFAEFSYRTHKSWSRARRVVAKAEYLDKGENPRFVVTSLDRRAVGRAGSIREVLLRPRRDGEPHQGADVPVRRPALHRRNEGQSVASLLLRAGLHAGRSAAPPGSERHRSGPRRRWIPSACKLFKIGAIVRISVRRVLLQLSSAYPWKDLYAHAFHALRC